MKRVRVIICGALILITCNTLSAIAPPPPATVPPAPTPPPALEQTATPTLGALEYIEGVYCWPSRIDTGAFDLMRFFGDGTVINAGVETFTDCADAWKNMSQYMTREQANTFNHGQYQLSGGLIRFDLAQARTETIIGQVTGTYEGDKLILTKGGAEALEYVWVATGN